MNDSNTHRNAICEQFAAAVFPCYLVTTFIIGVLAFYKMFANDLASLLHHPHRVGRFAAVGLIHDLRIAIDTNRIINHRILPVVNNLTYLSPESAVRGFRQHTFEHAVIHACSVCLKQFHHSVPPFVIHNIVRYNYEQFPGAYSLYHFAI